MYGYISLAQLSKNVSIALRTYSIPYAVTLSILSIFLKRTALNLIKN